MGFFRGSLLFTISILLFVSLLAANSFLTLSVSLGYENVQKEINPLIYELAGTYSGGENISYINETIHKEVQNSYYKEYDCDFWDCLAKEETPLFLISQKAKDYWNEKFYYSLLISLALVGLIFLLVQNKLNWPILVGSILILSALPLLKIKQFISLLIPEKLATFLLLLSIFFSKANTVFWISFILGLVLIGLGLGLKFSNTSFLKKDTENQKKEVERNGEEIEKKKITKRKK